MLGEYRFLRTKNGITRFAKVSVSADLDGEWLTSFDESLGELKERYGDVLQEGICMAQEWQRGIGGRFYHVRVLSLIESSVDTSVDAVRCAAAVATWKSFGHDESDVSVSFHDGRWIVALATED